LKRLPVRFNYNDNYYNSPLQGMPVNGYTSVIANILDHPGIEVKTGMSFDPAMRGEFEHVFFTGAIDAFYGFSLGRLAYRTVLFERVDGGEDMQGNAVINYPGMEVAHTRIHEHKHFAPWERHERSVAFVETSKETEAGDVPYYPKRLDPDKALLLDYTEMAREDAGVSFLGRLATYRYLDMHQVIAEALDFSERFLKLGAKSKETRFSCDPAR
jgi:UDP-galactopyranose mutase